MFPRQVEGKTISSDLQLNRDYGGMQVPYWDRDAKVIAYTTQTYCYLSSSLGGCQDQPNWIWLYAEISYNNPSWRELYSVASAQTFSGLEGTVAQVADRCAVAAVVITDVPPWLDFWYGSSTFAKYGSINGYYPFGAPEQPPQWINYPVASVTFQDNEALGFIITLPLGVKADVTLFSLIDTPPVISDGTPWFWPPN